MRLGFFVNDVTTELAAYTTTRLALTATNRGDEVWYFSAPDFTYGVDEKIHAHGTSVPKKKYSSQSAYLADLQSPRAVRQTVVIDDFDVLMPVSYTHLTLPTIILPCRCRWWPYH